VLTAFRLGEQARLPEGLWATADEPQRALHVLSGAAGGPVAIVSGRAFKSGEVDTRAPRLEIDGWLRDAVPATGQALGSWTAEWWDSMDGLPFVGPLTRDAKRLWVATGLGPQASTAVAAAGVLADRLAGRDSRWAHAYDATRVNTGISARRFLSENLDVAKRWIHDHVASPPVADADSLAPGEAALVAGDGGKIACYRDPSGKMHAVDATCTHLGCTVHWNAVSTCWDCPCHGSRFAIDGQVLHGPATRALAEPRWKAAAQATAGAAEPDAYRRAVDPEAALFDTPDAANMRPGSVPEATPAALLSPQADRTDAYRRAVDPEAALFDTPDAANMRPGVVPEAAPAAAVDRKDRDKPSAK
jgi:nitrite reductase/ring-hydroxylating ferredoxin subunit